MDHVASPLFSETVSKLPKLALNLWSFWFCFQNSWVTHVYHHAQAQTKTLLKMKGGVVFWDACAH